MVSSLGSEELLTTGEPNGDDDENAKAHGWDVEEVQGRNKSIEGK